jgi:hypothetical protein
VGQRRNKGGNQNFLEYNEDENKMYQNLWDTTKAVLRGLILKNMERYQTNDLRLHHILLEKQEQAKHKTSRR